MNCWWENYLKSEKILQVNPSSKVLVTSAVEGKFGVLTNTGSLAVTTGLHTGRAANDKYVVLGEKSEQVIDWSNNIHKIDQTNFGKIKSTILNQLNKDESTNAHLYIMERSACALPQYSLGIRLITNNPTHALFAHHIFREKVDQPQLGFFTIFHHPEPIPEIKAFGLNSTTAIIINMDLQEILITGTSYAGEIKKSIFSVLNVLLPQHGILPMHSGVNVTTSGSSSIFFGLSGTGKTTLSTDIDTLLVGDDEHGLCPEGIFNLEGGCYAKTLGLTVATEPQIFEAATAKEALLENVVLDQKTSEPHFLDSSLTENGRATYPLSFIQGSIKEGKCGLPKNIFFLTADAYGVLPAVSQLTPEQSIYYFLSGYTAKLAGTEVGQKKVSAAFSHCFGAPFMMCRPQVYSELFLKYMNQLKFKVWLINTGWYGGAYGVGRRYELSLTRNIIRAIQKSSLIQSQFEIEPNFSLSIPKEIEGVATERLRPSQSWSSKEEYEVQAKKLNKLFEDNYKRFQS
ncbi:MAG: phosphoenolpyruvate carboxykinase [Bacteriovoracaceae bacterium]